MSPLTKKARQARASRGGLALAQKLTKAQRSASARRAANARWIAYRKERDK